MYVPTSNHSLVCAPACVFPTLPGSRKCTGGQRDLSFSFWPKRHNFFGFTYGISDLYIRSLWDESDLMAYDDGECDRVNRLRNPQKMQFTTSYDSPLSIHREGS
jgi:hypothetical protein